MTCATESFTRKVVQSQPAGRRSKLSTPRPHHFRPHHERDVDVGVGVLEMVIDRKSFL